MANTTTEPSTPNATAPRAWHVTGAPDRPQTRALTISTVTSVAALVALVIVGTLVGEPLLIPPLAASMALIAGAAALPLAQPRNVIGGQLVSALTGFAVLMLAGHGPWQGAVAGGLALGVMLVLRVPHSPAAATAVIVALTSPAFGKFIGLLIAATIILVAVGAVGARFKGEHYPTYWW
jgi:CBS-domain-containing membrane protein